MFGFAQKTEFRTHGADTKRTSSTRIAPFLITLGTAAVAAVLAWQTWETYMGTPWTRDGRVRVYVVTIAPEVTGRIVELPIADNQFVRKGDLLMLIDPANYTIAVREAEAAVDQARAVAQNAQAESKRRQQLSDLAVTAEEQQTFANTALSADASYRLALARLDYARANLERTRILSPADGYITNLRSQRGDYANAGQRQISLVKADSFWVDGYFEESSLQAIRVGDGATIKLMAYSQVLRGQIEGIARGINVANTQPDASGLGSVNPVFSFVRLAQRVPVRIRINEVPDGIQLVAGMTATVQIDPRQVPVAEDPPALKSRADVRSPTSE
jgi:multidrug resistance efflux pump